MSCDSVDMELEAADNDSKVDDAVTSLPLHHLQSTGLNKVDRLHLLSAMRPSSCSGADSSPEPSNYLHLPTNSTETSSSSFINRSGSDNNIAARLDTPTEELLEDDDDAALEPIMVKLDITRKQCPSLVVEGYKFTRSRSSHAGPSTFWRCSKRTCRATATSWEENSVLQVKSVRMVHNHPPPEPCEFLVENVALEPGHQQMARVSRVLDPPRNGVARKRPASSTSGELLIEALPHRHVGRHQSGNLQVEKNITDSLSSSTGDIGFEHVFPKTTQYNASSTMYGSCVTQSHGLDSSTIHNKLQVKCSAAAGTGQTVNTTAHHPIAAQLILNLEEKHAVVSSANQTPPCRSVPPLNAFMQPIHGHAPSLGAFKTETAKPSPVKLVASVRSTSPLINSIAANMLPSTGQQLNGGEHLPLGASSVYPAPAQLLRMWSELGCHPMLQGQLAPSIMQHMQQIQQSAMGATSSMANLPISIFNQPHNRTPINEINQSYAAATSLADDKYGVEIDDQWSTQRNRLLITVAEIMRWAAEHFSASPRLARINTNFSAIIESIAKAD